MTSTEIARIDGRQDAVPGQLAKYLKQQITSIAGASASNIQPEKLCRIVVRAVQMNDQLQKCSMVSIFRASLISAELGLEIGGGTGQAYLVPFGKQCQFVPGYKGLVTLAYRSGMIEDVSARAVYRDDEFSINLAADPPFTHIPSLTGPREEKDIVCFYCVVRVRGSAYPHFDYMTKAEVDAIRNSSAGRNQAPWTQHYAEQGKKTVAKRALKMIPLSPETAKAINYDNATETGDFREVIFDFEDENPDLIIAPPPRKNNGDASVEMSATRAAINKQRAQEIQEPAMLNIPASIATLNQMSALAAEKKVGERKICMEIGGAEPQNLTEEQALKVIEHLEEM